MQHRNAGKDVGKMKKKLVCLILCLACLALGACQDAGDKQSDLDAPGVHLAYIVRDLRNPYWNNIIAGMQDALPQDYTLDIYDCVATKSNETQYAQQVVDAGYDGVFFSTAEYDGSADTIQILEQADVPIVVVDSSVDDAGACDAYVSTDSYAKGQMSMQTLVDEMGGSGTIAIIEVVKPGSAGLHGQGALDVVNQYPDIAIVEHETVVDKYSIAVYEMACQWLQEYPDLDGMWLANELMTDSIVEAMNTVGWDRPLLLAVGREANSTIGYLEAGTTCCAAVEQPTQIGAASMQAMQTLLSGQALTQKQILVMPKLVTKENLQEYADELASSGATQTEGV